MAGVCAAAVTYNYIGVLSKNIDYLALTLIAPLKTYYTGVHVIQSNNHFLHKQKPQ